MKVVQLRDEDFVHRIYYDIYDPSIYLDKKLIVFSNGKIEGIDNFLVFEDHVPVEAGEQLDKSMKEYDQSHRFMVKDSTDVEESLEEMKESLSEIKDIVNHDKEE